MRGLEFWILSYLLNSLWQVPLVFAAGWLVARALRSAGSAVEHRVWVIVLLLQSLLPACSLLPWEWLQRVSLWSGHASRPGEAHVSIVMGSGAGFGGFQLPGAVPMTIAILYGTISAYFAARFLWRSKSISAMRRQAQEVELSGKAAEFWARCARRFAIDNVSIAASHHVVGPVTMGVRRQLVLLPVRMVGVLPEADLETVIAHEFAHMHRQDFLKNLLYELFSLPVAYHPALWLTRIRIMESREMICDEMAAGINGQKDYARSLLRLARMLVEGTHAATPHTIGIFDANAFERRIMKLSKKHHEIRGVRRVALVAASAALGLGICGSALALAAHVNPVPAGDLAQDSKAPKQLSVSADVMAENVLTKAVPSLSGGG